MRVLFVSWRDLDHPNAGGSEVVVDTLARGLRARGHEVALLCGGPVGPREYPVIANGGTYSQYALAPWRYARHFRDVDLVVDVVNGMPFFSPLWRHAPRLGLVFHVHGEQWDRYFPTAVAAACSRIERRGLPLAYRSTHIATISASSADALGRLGIAPERTHVLDLGVDVAHPAEPVMRAAEPTFVALGRIAANKRLDTLLDLWKQVQPETGGRLVIAGDGPDRAQLEARIASDPALGSVVLEGRVDEKRKAELLHEAWLLVHTAEREGWGLSIVEAGACGTPTLAYRVDGVRDAVDDGVTGVLVDSDRELADRWIELASQPERLEMLGAAAARRAATFTWDRTVDQFLAAADAAIADHRARRNRPHPDRAVGDDLHHPLAAGPRSGLARSVHLFQLFRREPVDPDRFYHYLAADTVRHVRRYMEPRDGIAVDVGGGPGYVAEALKAAGARCVVVEYNAAELGLHDRTPDAAVQGDGQALPLRDGGARLVHSSNVLEHVPDWEAMLAEMVRVLEPGTGTGYLTFTNWYSPWGGHETSPWHYLGGARAVERYRSSHGEAPKNEYGTSLFRLHITQVLRWFAARPDVEVLWVGPRYLPEWMRWIVDVRGVREVVTWNLVVVFRKRSGGDAGTFDAGARAEAAA